MDSCHIYVQFLEDVRFAHSFRSPGFPLHIGSIRLFLCDLFVQIRPLRAQRILHQAADEPDRIYTGHFPSPGTITPGTCGLRITMLGAAGKPPVKLAIAGEDSELRREPGTLPIRADRHPALRNAWLRRP